MNHIDRKKLKIFIGGCFIVGKLKTFLLWNKSFVTNQVKNIICHWSIAFSYKQLNLFKCKAFPYFHCWIENLLKSKLYNHIYNFFCSKHEKMLRFSIIISVKSLISIIKICVNCIDIYGGVIHGISDKNSSMHSCQNFAIWNVFFIDFETTKKYGYICILFVVRYLL